MKTAWPEVTLEAHCDLLSGFAFKSKQFTDDPGDVPLIKGENVGKGEILWDKSKRWPSSDANVYDRFWLQENDVVLAMDRPIVGGELKFAWIKPHDPPSLLVQRVARLRGANGISTRFLRCLIASPQFKSYIDTIITGVNVPHISGRDIKRFSFRLPDEHTQERVVDVLSSYDGLIENNRRRIALLEEAAGQLYREWFDRLRFPGYEHTRIADGVPDGWRNVTFGDCATMLSGGTPSKKNSRYWDGDIPWVTAKDLKVNRILDSKNHVTDDGADNGTRRVPAGTILFVVRGMSLAKEFRVAVATREVTFNQDLKALRIKEGVAPHFLFNFLMASKRQIMGICGEAAHGTKKLETDRLLSLPVLLPDDRIQRQYVEFAKPTFDLMQRLEQQSLRLAEARDLLLPRLISGEVEV